MIEVPPVTHPPAVDGDAEPAILALPVADTENPADLTITRVIEVAPVAITLLVVGINADGDCPAKESALCRVLTGTDTTGRESTELGKVTAMVPDDLALFVPVKPPLDPTRHSTAVEADHTVAIAAVPPIRDARIVIALRAPPMPWDDETTVTLIDPVAPGMFAEVTEEVLA